MMRKSRQKNQTVSLAKSKPAKNFKTHFLLIRETFRDSELFLMCRLKKPLKEKGDRLVALLSEMAPVFMDHELKPICFTQSNFNLLALQ